MKLIKLIYEPNSFDALMFVSYTQMDSVDVEKMISGLPKQTTKTTNVECHLQQSSWVHEESENTYRNTYTVGFLDSVPYGICLLNAFSRNAFIIYGEIVSVSTQHTLPSLLSSYQPPMTLNLPHVQLQRVYNEAVQSF